MSEPKIDPLRDKILINLGPFEKLFPKFCSFPQNFVRFVSNFGWFSPNFGQNFWKSWLFEETFDFHSFWTLSETKFWIRVFERVLRYEKGTLMARTYPVPICLSAPSWLPPFYLRHQWSFDSVTSKYFLKYSCVSWEFKLSYALKLLVLLSTLLKWRQTAIRLLCGFFQWSST